MDDIKSSDDNAYVTASLSEQGNCETTPDTHGSESDISDLCGGSDNTKTDESGWKGMSGDSVNPKSIFSSGWRDQSMPHLQLEF